MSEIGQLVRHRNSFKWRPDEEVLLRAYFDGLGWDLDIYFFQREVGSSAKHARRLKRNGKWRKLTEKANKLIERDKAKIPQPIIYTMLR